MNKIRIQDIKDDLERLPWDNIFKKLNKNYQKVIPDYYKGKVAKFLKRTGINEVSYIPPVFGKAPDHTFVTSDFKKISSHLTKRLRAYLIAEGVPKEISDDFYVTSATISYLYRRNRTYPCTKWCCGELIVRRCWR